MTYAHRFTLALLLSPFLAILLWGCENDTGNDVAGPGGGTDKTCLACHSSETALKEALGTGEIVLAAGIKDDG